MLFANWLTKLLRSNYSNSMKQRRRNASRSPGNRGRYLRSTAEILEDRTLLTTAIPTGLDLLGAQDSGESTSDNITNVTTPAFSGTAVAGSTVEIFADGALIATTTANPALGGFFFVSSSALGDGSYDITATADDGVSGVSDPSVALPITIDTAAPNAPSAPDLEAASDSGSSSTDDNTSTTTPPSRELPRLESPSS